MKSAKFLMMLSLVVMALLSPTLVFAAGERDPVTIGEVAGWEDVEIMGSMIEYLIQKIGYPVEVIYADLGVLLTGLSEGDIDLYPGLCLPVCHARYFDELTPNVRALGPGYMLLYQGVQVPGYIPASKLSTWEDFKDPEVIEKLDAKIIGIEPGSGFMENAEKTMEEYGLFDLGYELVAGSEAAMRAALKKAVEKEEWIAVLLKRPQYLNAEYNMRPIEEPTGVWNSINQGTVAVNSGFLLRFPFQISAAIARYYISDSVIADLIREYDEGGGTFRELSRQWMDNHPKFVHYWLTGEIDGETVQY